MPDAAFAAAVCLRLGNLRYFLTGITLLLLVTLTLRAFGRLLDPFAQWRVFRGKIAETDGSGTLTVTFTDRNRLQHTAAFRSGEPGAAALKPGDSVRFAIRTAVFVSGEYPGSLADAEPAGRDILLRSEQKRLLRSELLRTAAVQAVICGIMLAVFLVTKRICFPPR
ncbi:MAG: hypothetical protein IJ060_03155 [Oscillospiraceae bacterium]|nr:hypothetical protein [Oscillospiraceae bacterium]